MTSSLLHLLAIVLGGLTALESLAFFYLVHKGRLPRVVLLAPLVTAVLFLVVLILLMGVDGSAPPSVY